MIDLKNLKISLELHRKIKIYCVTNSIKLNDWVEKSLNEKINELNDKMDKR